MGQIQNSVFISYRHANSPLALAIYQYLDANGFEVFIDYESLKSGDFEQTIIENIKARAHFIIILTPSALDRCNEPEDWLRREIEAAISHKRNIVPILMENFSFDDPNIRKHLTGKLEQLSTYQGLEVPTNFRYFKYAMQELRENFLTATLDTVLHPPSNSTLNISVNIKTAAKKVHPIKQEELASQDWFEKGYIAQEAKEFDNAIRYYSKVIKLNPRLAEPYNNRGSCKAQKGDLDSAIIDFREALRLSPNGWSLFQV